MAGSAKIGAIHVSLGLDSAQFEAGMKRANGSVKEMSATTKAAFLAIGAAVAAAAAGIAIAVKGSIDHFDTLSKTAQKIGLTVESLAKLEYAAKMSDVSLESLATGVKKLSQNMADVAAGAGSTAKRGFDMLGVSVKKADGTLKTSDALLAEVADKFQNMPDGVNKTAAAVAIFGRAGADLIPMLNAGSAGLDEAAAKAERFGLVISGTTARQAEAFNDNLTDLGLVATGMGNKLATAVLPALVAISAALVEAALHAGDLVPYLATAAATLVGLAAPAIIASIGAASTAIGVGMVGAVRALTAAMLANPLGLLVAGIATAVTAAFMFRDQIKEAIGIDFVAIIGDAVNKVIGAFVGGFEAIKATWALLPRAIADIVIQTANSMITGVEAMINKSIELINSFVDNANGALGNIGINIGKIGGVQFGGFENPFAGAAADAGAAAGAAVTGAMSVDYLGQLGDAMAGFGQTADGAAASVAGLNTELDGNGGGGKTTKTLKDKIDETKLSADGLGDSLKSAFKGFITDIKDGKGWLESLGSALNKIADKLLDMALDGLFNIFGGTGGGGGGGGIFGFLGGLFGIPGFANGTNNAPGGLAMVGERGPELVNLPRGSQVIPNKDLRGSEMNVRVSLDNAMLKAVVTDEAGRVVGQAAPAIVGASVQQSNKSAPGAMARYQNDQAGSDYRL